MIDHHPNLSPLYTGPQEAGPMIEMKFICSLDIKGVLNLK